MRSILQNNYKTNLITVVNQKVNSIFHRNYNSLQHIENRYVSGLLNKDVPIIAEVLTKVSLGDTGLVSVKNIYGGFCNHMDIIGQMNPWNLIPYSIHSVFHNAPKLYNKLDPYYTTQINAGAFNQKIYVDKRLNTVQEIICANAAPNYMAITKLDFNTSISNIPRCYNNLTGQTRPDYIGCLVTLDGDRYIYYIDLKRTTLRNFEMTILGNLPGKNVYCNIHLLGDVDQNQKFSQNLQPYLIKSYHDVYNYNINSNDLIAMKVAKSSLPHFNYFLANRDIDSWNRIPLNTSKFLTLDMLKNFYY